ncbi:hypothetical protein [Spirochaeta cellobiosiphila]|uniref:hypothetical protein n=1 Tax=Spirochaeta cellobiosiphila TaxID=504483 RepID=UPI0003F570C7|nr:hypothetical protein [Spirochaeta cellobiosiphila]
MELSISISLFSVLIASFSLIHSITSSRRSNRNSIDISKNELRSNSLIAFSQASEKYIEEIHFIDNRFTEITNELVEKSTGLIDEIGNTLEEYCFIEKNKVDLKYSLLKLVKEIREYYDHELLYQYGLNLNFRLNHLRYINSEYFKITNKYFKFINNFFFRNNIESPEEHIMSSPIINWNYELIYNSIDKKDYKSILIDIYKKIEPFKETYKKNLITIEDLKRRMEQLVSENKYEIFDIMEIPNLRKLQTHLDLIHSFYINDFEIKENYKIVNAISFIIYLSTYLYIVSDYKMWGKYQTEVIS